MTKVSLLDCAVSDLGTFKNELDVFEIYFNLACWEVRGGISQTYA